MAELVLRVIVASATSGDVSNPLVAYGLLGVILTAFTVLLVTGKLVIGREHDRVIAETDEQRRMMPDVIKALNDSTTALSESAKVQRDTLVLLEVIRRTGPTQAP